MTSKDVNMTSFDGMCPLGLHMELMKGGNTAKCSLSCKKTIIVIMCTLNACTYRTIKQEIRGYIR